MANGGTLCRWDDSVHRGETPETGSVDLPGNALALGRQGDSPGPAILFVGGPRGPPPTYHLADEATGRALGEPQGPSQVDLTAARVKQQLHQAVSQ